MPPPTKRRRIETKAVEEVTFDLAARQEYLTGFHKRKVERAKHAQENAAKRAREERISDRKKLREERKADLDRHVQEVNAILKQSREVAELDGLESGSVDDWDGMSSPEPPPVDHEAEYIDEDKYTTVTVEAIDLSREGIFNADAALQNKEAAIDQVGTGEEPQEGSDPPKPAKRKWSKEKSKGTDSKPKAKRKKFRYENKAERKFTRMKQKSKNSKAAQARREG